MKRTIYVVCLVALLSAITVILVPATVTHADASTAGVKTDYIPVGNSADVIYQSNFSTDPGLQWVSWLSGNSAGRNDANGVIQFNRSVSNVQFECDLHFYRYPGGTGRFLTFGLVNTTAQNFGPNLHYMGEVERYYFTGEQVDMEPLTNNEWYHVVFVMVQNIAQLALYHGSDLVVEKNVITTANEWDGLGFQAYGLYSYPSLCTWNPAGYVQLRAETRKPDEFWIDNVSVTEYYGPIARFTVNRTWGYAPLTVLFTDLSVGDGITDWDWDFDGDGLVDATNQNPSWTYEDAGIYSVSLDVTNAFGSNKDVQNEYIIALGEGDTWYVDDSGGADFTTIQEAVDAASPGDTIFVLNGTYSGPSPGSSDFVINKPHLRIIGEGANVVTFDGGTTVGFRIPDKTFDDATDTVLKGMKITNTKTIRVGQNGPSDDSVIRDCIFEGTGGISTYSQNIIFENNTVANLSTSVYGLVIHSKDGRIANNTFDHIAGDALALYGARATNNTITGNSFISNGGVVQFYDSGNDNRIFLNTMVNNTNLVTISGVVPNTTYWSSPSAISYLYNGTTYRNYLGNYWDGDYTGTDSDGDGIGNTPFTVPDGLGTDHWPLMMPFENYHVLPPPKTWYVDDSGGADFMTIQAAVDTATDWDTIIVRDGLYIENVAVNKSITIASENGSAAVAVTAAVPTAPVFDVNADGVTIDGFTVSGPTNEHVAGIELVDANSCMIVNNTCSGGCYNGIHLGGNATENTVTRNYCHNNTRRGISLRDTATGNFVFENTCENNGEDELCIKDSTYDNFVWLNNFLGSVECLTNNTYHSPTPLMYTYNGRTYTNYLGNYYSGYAGADSDGDGIGDTPFSFDGSSYSDDYPLMAPFEEYFGEPGLCGDVNSDDRVTMGDGRLIYLNVIYGDTEYPLANPWAADVNGDGKITMGDGRLVYLNVIYGAEAYPIECGS